jgi:hypothetical protein
MMIIASLDFLNQFIKQKKIKFGMNSIKKNILMNYVLFTIYLMMFSI